MEEIKRLRNLLNNRRHAAQGPDTEAMDLIDALENRIKNESGALELILEMHRRTCIIGPNK